MSAEIFRKVALERLSTPDQLDQALLLTPSTIRLALYFAAAVVAAIVLASLLVSVPITASGIGIVLQEQGVAEVMAPSGGRVLKVLVNHGQSIQNGQLLAQLAQPDQENALQTTRAELLDLQNQRTRILRIQAASEQVQQRQRQQQRAELAARLVSTRSRQQWLEQRMKQDQALRDSGYLSQNKVKDTEAELLQMRDQMAQIESQIKTIASDEAASLHANERETLDLDVRIATLEHRRAELSQKLAHDSNLYSDQQGVVAEMKIAAGDMLASGQPVISLLPTATTHTNQASTAPGQAKAPADSGLQVVAYLASGEAKKVRPGMAIRVTPGNVKKEEFGSIVGKVISVAPIPATFEGMQHTLRNRTLVQTLAQTSAPIEVRLALQSDPLSPSGLRWTSRGPNYKLEAGTTVQAEVVVKRMRLLVLALPALESWLHLEPDA